MPSFKSEFANHVEEAFGRDTEVMKALRAGEEEVLKTLLAERSNVTLRRSLGLLQDGRAEKLEELLQAALHAEALLESLWSGEATLQDPLGPPPGQEDVPTV